MSTELGRLGEDTAALSRWIDESPGYIGLDREAHIRRRCDKTAEESGEVIRAMGGYFGENPRKGVTHTLADIESELLDVALAALGAVEHLHGNDGSSARRLDAHVCKVLGRAGLEVRRQATLGSPA